MNNKVLNLNFELFTLKSKEDPCLIASNIIEGKIPEHLKNEADKKFMQKDNGPSLLIFAWKSDNLYAYYKEAKIGKVNFCKGKLKLKPVAISKDARFILGTESKKSLFLVYDLTNDTYQEIKFRPPSWITSPSIITWVSEEGNTCLLFEVDIRRVCLLHGLQTGKIVQSEFMLETNDNSQIIENLTVISSVFFKINFLPMKHIGCDIGFCINGSARKINVVTLFSIEFEKLEINILEFVIMNDMLSSCKKYKNLIKLAVDFDIGIIIPKFNEKDLNLCGVLHVSETTKIFTLTIEDEKDNAVKIESIYNDNTPCDDFAWINLDEPYILLLTRNYDLKIIDMHGNKIMILINQQKPISNYPLGKLANIKRKYIEYQNCFNINDEGQIILCFDKTLLLIDAANNNINSNENNEKERATNLEKMINTEKVINAEKASEIEKSIAKVNKNKFDTSNIIKLSETKNKPEDLKGSSYQNYSRVITENSEELRPFNPVSNIVLNYELPNAKNSAVTIIKPVFPSTGKLAGPTEKSVLGDNSKTNIRESLVIKPTNPIMGNSFSETLADIKSELTRNIGLLEKNIPKEDLTKKDHYNAVSRINTIILEDKVPGDFTIREDSNQVVLSNNDQTQVQRLSKPEENNVSEIMQKPKIIGSTNQLSNLQNLQESFQLGIKFKSQNFMVEENEYEIKQNLIPSEKLLEKSYQPKESHSESKISSFSNNFNDVKLNQKQSLVENITQPNKNVRSSIERNIVNSINPHENLIQNNKIIHSSLERNIVNPINSHENVIKTTKIMRSSVERNIVDPINPHENIIQTAKIMRSSVERNIPNSINPPENVIQSNKVMSSFLERKITKPTNPLENEIITNKSLRSSSERNRTQKQINPNHINSAIPPREDLTKLGQIQKVDNPLQSNNELRANEIQKVSSLPQKVKEPSSNNLQETPSIAYLTPQRFRKDYCGYTTNQSLISTVIETSLSKIDSNPSTRLNTSINASEVQENLMTRPSNKSPEIEAKNNELLRASKIETLSRSNPQKMDLLSTSLPKKNENFYENTHNKNVSATKNPEKIESRLNELQSTLPILNEKKKLQESQIEPYNLGVINDQTGKCVQQKDQIYQKVPNVQQTHNQHNKSGSAANNQLVKEKVDFQQKDENKSDNEPNRAQNHMKLLEVANKLENNRQKNEIPLPLLDQNNPNFLQKNHFTQKDNETPYISSTNSRDFSSKSQEYKVNIDVTYDKISDKKLELENESKLKNSIYYTDQKPIEKSKNSHAKSTLHQILNTNTKLSKPNKSDYLELKTIENSNIQNDSRLNTSSYTKSINPLKNDNNNNSSSILNESNSIIIAPSYENKDLSQSRIEHTSMFLDNSSISGITPIKMDLDKSKCGSEFEPSTSAVVIRKDDSILRNLEKSFLESSPILNKQIPLNKSLLSIIPQNHESQIQGPINYENIQEELNFTTNFQHIYISNQHDKPNYNHGITFWLTNSSTKTIISKIKSKLIQHFMKIFSIGPELTNQIILEEIKNIEVIDNYILENYQSKPPNCKRIWLYIIGLILNTLLKPHLNMNDNIMNLDQNQELICSIALYQYTCEKIFLNGAFTKLNSKLFQKELFNKELLNIPLNDSFINLTDKTKLIKKLIYKFNEEDLDLIKVMKYLQLIFREKKCALQEASMSTYLLYMILLEIIQNINNKRYNYHTISPIFYMDMQLYFGDIKSIIELEQFLRIFMQKNVNMSKTQFKINNGDIKYQDINLTNLIIYLSDFLNLYHTILNFIDDTSYTTIDPLRKIELYLLILFMLKNKKTMMAGKTSFQIHDYKITDTQTYQKFMDILIINLKNAIELTWKLLLKQINYVDAENLRSPKYATNFISVEIMTYFMGAKFFIEEFQLTCFLNLNSKLKTILVKITQYEYDYQINIWEFMADHFLVNLGPEELSLWIMLIDNVNCIDSHHNNLNTPLKELIDRNNIPHVPLFNYLIKLLMVIIYITNEEDLKNIISKAKSRYSDIEISKVDRTLYKIMRRFYFIFLKIKITKIESNLLNHARNCLGCNINFIKLHFEVLENKKFTRIITTLEIILRQFNHLLELISFENPTNFDKNTLKKIWDDLEPYKSMILADENLKELERKATKIYKNLGLNESDANGIPMMTASKLFSKLAKTNIPIERFINNIINKIYPLKRKPPQRWNEIIVSHRELLEKILSEYKKLGDRYGSIFNKDTNSYQTLWFEQGKWYLCYRQSVHASIRRSNDQNFTLLNKELNPIME